MIPPCPPCPRPGIHSVVLALSVLVLAGSPTRAVGGTHVEEFDVTTYRDAAATTADWNTATGTLRLHPFPGGPPTPVEPTALGSYATLGNARDVRVIGTTAYVVSFASSGPQNYLHILDVADPSHPALLGSLPLDPALGIDVVGDIAYVADHFSGLRIVDVSEPTTPVLLGTYDTPDAARGVVVIGDLAYVADGFSASTIGNPEAAGLHIIDVSDPAQPARVGRCDLPSNAQGITVSGDLAYVACFEAGLQIVDVSDPANPTVIGSLDTPGFARQIRVEGDVAYLTDDTAGLKIIDVSDPTQPSLLGSYNTPGSASGLDVVGDVVYVGDGNPGMQIIDVSHPTNPALIDTYNTPLVAIRVDVVGTVAYVADSDSGLRIIEVTQDRFDLANHTGQSLAINGGEPLRYARLLATQVPGVAWELTSNGGGSWLPATPGVWVDLGAGSDLRWRTTLTPTSPIATAAAPEVSRVEFQWTETLLDAGDTGAPRSFRLRDPAPNPVRSATAIGYDVPAAGGDVRIAIFDLGGRRVRSLVEGAQAPGQKSVSWNGRDDGGRTLAPGLYLVRMQAPGFSSVRRLLLTR